MNPGYVMGYQQPVALGRCSDLTEGKLDVDDIVLLMQDLCEAGVLSQLSSQFHWLAQHCADNGFVTVYGRQLQ
jgi:hypothetical protein